MLCFPMPISSLSMPLFFVFEHKIGLFVLGLLLSAASGRVIADFFEILHGEGGIRLPWQSRGLL